MNMVPYSQFITPHANKVHVPLLSGQTTCTLSYLCPYLCPQAVTKAYSLHDSRSVGISNKSEFNTESMAPMYPVLTWSEFGPDMHHGFYGKWSLNKI